MLKNDPKSAKKCPKKLWKKCLKMIKKENSEFGIRNSALFDDSEFGIRSSEIFLKIRNSEFGVRKFENLSKPTPVIDLYIKIRG